MLDTLMEPLRVKSKVHQYTNTTTRLISDPLRFRFRFRLHQFFTRDCCCCRTLLMLFAKNRENPPTYLPTYLTNSIRLTNSQAFTSVKYRQWSRN